MSDTVLIPAEGEKRSLKDMFSKRNVIAFLVFATFAVTLYYIVFGKTSSNPAVGTSPQKNVRGKKGGTVVPQRRRLQPPATPVAARHQAPPPEREMVASDTSQQVNLNHRKPGYTEQDEEQRLFFSDTTNGDVAYEDKVMRNRLSDPTLRPLGNGGFVEEEEKDAEDGRDVVTDQEDAKQKHEDARMRKDADPFGGECLFPTDEYNMVTSAPDDISKDPYELIRYSEDGTAETAGDGNALRKDFVRMKEQRPPPMVMFDHMQQFGSMGPKLPKLGKDMRPVPVPKVLTISPFNNPASAGTPQYGGLGEGSDGYEGVGSSMGAPTHWSYDVDSFARRERDAMNSWGIAQAKDASPSSGGTCNC
jgi:hypothetical protein